jgi:hypothetical protein
VTTTIGVRTASQNGSIPGWRCAKAADHDRPEKHASAATPTLVYFSPRSTRHDRIDQYISVATTALMYFSPRFAP